MFTPAFNVIRIITSSTAVLIVLIALIVSIYYTVDSSKVDDRKGKPTSNKTISLIILSYVLGFMFFRAILVGLQLNGFDVMIH